MTACKSSDRRLTRCPVIVSPPPWRTADRRISRILAAGLCSFLVSGASVAAEEPAFSFRKEIAPATKSEETLIAVPLDADVYFATQPGLADVRLLSPDGKTMPFVLRRAPGDRSKVSQRSYWSRSKPVLRPLDEGGLEITLNLGQDDPVPQGLRVVSPLKNFEQRVRVQTSDDGQDWTAAGVETLIFDYSRYMDVRNDEVPFPAGSHKHIKVIIDDVTSEQQSELLELTRQLRGDQEEERTERIVIDRRPFRIDRLDFWRDVSPITEVRKQSYPVTRYSTETDAKTRQTIVAITTHREPLTELVLQTSSRNFSRLCTVEVEVQQGVKKTWQPVASATLSRMDFKSLKRETLSITFPESRQISYRLVIENRDSEPLEVTGIDAIGNVYEVAFLAAAKSPYQLLYGNPEAPEPQYDSATLETLLREYSPEPTTLGPEVLAGPVTAPGFKLSSLVNDPRILTMIIGVLVVALGWGLYSATKRLENTALPEPATPPPPSDSPSQPE